MKNWHETTEILAELGRWVEAGRRAAVATVVAIRGSAYRRPGAKLLVRDDGRTDGSISGGCLESDVRERALAAIRAVRPALAHYDTDDQAVWGLGLGCNGAVEILIQPFSTPAALAPLRPAIALLGGDEPFAVSTIVDGERAGTIVVQGAGGDAGGANPVARAAGRLLAAGTSRLHQVGEVRVFTEVQLPPPRLLVFGAGDDAIALADLASRVGFRVGMVDHRPAFLSEDRFPSARLLRARPEDGTGALPVGPATYAVVKTHSLANDRAWVRALLATAVPYVGVLGPRARTAELLRDLGAADDPRVHGPVGLDLGAEGPEQVALSIVAELLAVRAGREPVELRRKEGPIHG